ncbi:MAG: ion channel [Thermodesulfobacteriota bacterium]|nr:ion channel [Thermodesulfobacteriota bacterium]
MENLKNRHYFEEPKFRNLLLLLLLYIVGVPFLEPYPSLTVLAHISLSMVLVVAIYAVNKHRHQRSVAIALLLPLIVLYWLDIYDVVSFSRLGSQLLLAVFFGLLVYSFTVQIANASRVSANVLYMTLSLYLIIGLFWGALYTLLQEVSPGAYSGALLDNAQNTTHIFTYFSFVTLTTLGYGDITPQTAGASSLCHMEAIVGQFYTAVVVAWLVGMFVSEKQNEDR